MKENGFQAKVVKWLRDQGVYVIVTRVLPGVPVGCPDVIGLYGPRHCDIEVKKGPNAPFRPGQQPTLERLRKGNDYVYVVYPENWDETKADLCRTFLVANW